MVSLSSRLGRFANRRVIVTTIALLAIPSVVLAQEKQQDIPVERITAFVCIFPLLVLLAALLVFLYIFVRRSGAMKQGEYLALAREHMERTNAHMANQEDRELKIIELLESIELELKHRESIKKV